MIYSYHNLCIAFAQRSNLKSPVVAASRRFIVLAGFSKTSISMPLV